jgi:hypothetical protein
MEWKHPGSPRKKMFKVTPPAGIVLAPVFWDSSYVLLVDVLERGLTGNADRYCDMQKACKRPSGKNVSLFLAKV